MKVIELNRKLTYTDPRKDHGKESQSSLSSRTRSNEVPNNNKAFLCSQSLVMQPSLHSTPRLIRAARARVV